MKGKSKARAVKSPVKIVEAIDRPPKVTQPVNLKLTPTERRYLDSLIERQWYQSRSGALRAGLGLLMAKHGITPQQEAQIERERRKHQPRFHGCRKA